MNGRLKFWQSPGNWPRDTADFVFLGRAVHSIGEAMFPQHWIGEEPIIDLLPRRPGRIRFDSGMVKEKSVCKNWPPSRGSLRPMGSEEGPLSAKLNTAMMRADSELAPALERFRSVQAEIATMAEAGKLVTASRRKVGGEILTMPKVWWSTERLISRFDYCHVDPDDPFDTGKVGGSYSWVFVSRSGLDQAISILTKEEPTVRDGGQPETIPTIKKVTAEKKEIEQQYLARVQSYKGKTPPTRAEDEAFCREKLGVNRSRARALRKQFAPTDWQKAGPRRKKTQE